MKPLKSRTKAELIQRIENLVAEDLIKARIIREVTAEKGEIRKKLDQAGSTAQGLLNLDELYKKKRIEIQQIIKTVIALRYPGASLYEPCLDEKSDDDDIEAVRLLRMIYNLVE